LGFDGIKEKAFEHFDDSHLTLPERISMGRKYSLPKLIYMSYATLAIREEPISPDEAELLGYDVAYKMSLVREKLYRDKSGSNYALLQEALKKFFGLEYIKLSEAELLGIGLERSTLAVAISSLSESGFLPYYEKDVVTIKEYPTPNFRCSIKKADGTSGISSASNLSIYIKGNIPYNRNGTLVRDATTFWNRDVKERLPNFSFKKGDFINVYHERDGWGFLPVRAKDGTETYLHRSAIDYIRS